MANPLPLTIDFGVIPNTGNGYTVQEMADRFGLNARIFTGQSFALFTTGATSPTSDTGPWAKNGNTWYYWDTGTGSYVPFLVPQESLEYYVGSTTPDQTVYQFWIQLDGSGSPLALKTYYGGAWVDVYATTLAGYVTSTTLAGYSTTSQMNSAISSAIAGINSYPAQANNSVAQTIGVDGAAHKVTLDQAFINSAPSPFDTTNSRYVAPVAGIYAVSANTQFDNNTGTASGMQVNISVYKNGSPTSPPLGDLDNTPSPSGSRWSPGFGGLLIQLALSDYVELWASLDDGVNTGNMNMTSCTFNVVKVG